MKPLALPEAHFEFKFEPMEQANAEGLSTIQLLFTANKGIPPQPLARVASGGELSRIALVMQVMNAEKTEAEVLVFDEIDVGISGGTAEVVGGYWLIWLNTSNYFVLRIKPKWQHNLISIYW